MPRVGPDPTRTAPQVAVPPQCVELASYADVEAFSDDAAASNDTLETAQGLKNNVARDLREMQALRRAHWPRAKNDPRVTTRPGLPDPRARPDPTRPATRAAPTRPESFLERRSRKPAKSKQPLPACQPSAICLVELRPKLVCSLVRAMTVPCWCAEEDKEAGNDRRALVSGWVKAVSRNTAQVYETAETVIVSCAGVHKCSTPAWLLNCRSPRPSDEAIY